jgi:hypothetical protein
LLSDSHSSRATRSGNASAISSRNLFNRGRQRGAAHLVCVTITLQAAPTTNASAHRQANDRITRSSNMTWELLAELVPAQPHFRTHVFISG